MPAAIESVPTDQDVAVDLQRTLAWYRHGSDDPTTRLSATAMARACWTPQGPATTFVDWSDGSLRIDAWGPGRDHAQCATRAMLGLQRVPDPIPGHPVLWRASRQFQGVRTGASGDLYHELLPTVLAQRITGGEAVRQWAKLCHALGEPAPGPDLGLTLPPHPDALAGRPAWWFHPLGIEAKRARTLTEVGRIAGRLWDWVQLPLDELANKLALVRGIGPWTVGSVMGPVCGDDDAVAVGDFHLPNLVAWNLAGQARADDARMLELLEPFRGQRGRVLRLLGLAGARPPAFGPRRRILPMHRW